MIKPKIISLSIGCYALLRTKVNFSNKTTLAAMHSNPLTQHSSKQKSRTESINRHCNKDTIM